MSQVKTPSPVDIDMLTMALQAGDLNTGWWLDTHTGEVIPAPHKNGDAHEQATLKARESDPERYIDIDPLPEIIMVELMESFVVTLDHDPDFCELLRGALEKQQSTWHFKCALANDPAHEDAWYAFKDQFYALQARQWARDKGLDYEVRHSEQVNGDGASVHKQNKNGLLQLTAEHNGVTRYYEITRQEELTFRLTAYQGQDASGELLAATNLLAAQLEGINPVLAQLPRQLDTESLPSDDTAEGYTQLRIRQGAGELTYICPQKAGEPGEQLRLLFNVLLGIS